jgi:hypothetical protein
MRSTRRVSGCAQTLVPELWGGANLDASSSTPLYSYTALDRVDMPASSRDVFKGLTIAPYKQSFKQLVPLGQPSRGLGVMGTLVQVSLHHFWPPLHLPRLF